MVLHFKLKMFALPLRVGLVSPPSVRECANVNIIRCLSYHARSANPRQELWVWTNQNTDKVNAKLFKSVYQYSSLDA